MYSKFKKFIFGSNTLLKLAVVPANNISIIIASHIMSLTTTIGMYMAKEVTKIGIYSVFKLGVIILNYFF